MVRVIRIDADVEHELEKRAMEYDLVFGSPNDVLRKVLGLDQPKANQFYQVVDIDLGKIHTPRQYGLIPIPPRFRNFFPGYKVPFDIETDQGVIKVQVTSAPKGTPIGDPEEGKYIVGKLQDWYSNNKHLQDGAILRIEALKPGKQYKLSILRAQR